MKKSIIKAVAAASVLLSIVVGGCGKTTIAETQLPVVRTQIIKGDNGRLGFNYSGEVRGRYESQLAFQVSGKVIQRNVELGSRVQAGDVLLAIDSKDIVQNVNITNAQVASAQSQLTLAAANLERYRTLYAQGAISQAQLDQYQNSYEVAQAAVRQASAQYAQGNNQLGYSTLQADSSGVVSAINAESGQVVNAGQALVTLVRDGEWEIEINVPENRVEEIRKTAQVAISFWALPGVNLAGNVREISPMADKVARTYKVRISMQNPPSQVSLGMTASVTAMGGGAATAVYVPLSAIYQTDNTPHVWVVKEGAVQLRPIQIGAFGDGKVQVIAGLAEGEVIVTAGVQKLRPGERVRT